MAESYDPTNYAHPLLLKDAPLLLRNDYLPFEAGWAVNAEGMHHIAASTYMRHCTGAMVDWWFGFIHKTEQYVLWHPRDHVFSDWDGPRNNDSTYIGGHHLVHEYIGSELSKLKISFKDPADYFGADWVADFKKYGYSTAVCGRVGMWDEKTGGATYVGHLIHLVKDEPDGCRMRSRFWLGDVDGVTDPKERAVSIKKEYGLGMLQHSTEEMAILGSRLPAMYADFAKKD